MLLTLIARLAVFFPKLPWAIGLAGFALAGPTWAQPLTAALSGQVVDQQLQKPLGFVSVGVVRQPYGTVANAQGRFALDLPGSYDNDSVRFSLVGYASRTWQVGDLRRQLRAGPVVLKAQPVPLAEVKVSSAGLRRRVLGNSTQTVFRIDGFAANTAGNQIGQRIFIKHPAFLDEVSFRLYSCSYDTVYLRLNIYKLRQDYPAENLLPAAVYLKIGQQQARKRIYLNLHRYKLCLTEDVVVALELVNSLGRGELWFAQPLMGGGPCYKLQQTPGPGQARNTAPKNSIKSVDLTRKQPDGPWTKYPSLGVDIDATVLQLPD